VAPVAVQASPAPASPAPRAAEDAPGAKGAADAGPERERRRLPESRWRAAER
jgi:hypothetical protein